MFLTDRNVILNTQLTTAQADLADIQANGCGGAANDNTTAALYLLHADHRGRPAFATETDGTVIWDGGITTPFGEAIETMGAITQQLMFPGQYADAETGLSHDWHRTYDPTLGRYLQADPIGLAGGLNRYAYVGGNPMGYVDPMGLVALGDFIDPSNYPGSEADNLARYILSRPGVAQKHLMRNCLSTNLPANLEQADLNYDKRPNRENIYHQFDVNFPGDRRGNRKFLFTK